MFSRHSISVGAMWSIPPHADLLPAVSTWLAYCQQLERQGQVADAQTRELQ